MGPYCFSANTGKPEQRNPYNKQQLVHQHYIDKQDSQEKQNSRGSSKIFCKTSRLQYITEFQKVFFGACYLLLLLLVLGIVNVSSFFLSTELWQRLNEKTEKEERFISHHQIRGEHIAI